MDKSEVPLYRVASFFLIRSPLLPGRHFDNLAKDDASISQFSDEEQSLIREALAIASPSFYKSFLKNQTQTKKQKEQIKNTLLKYLLRMSSRSTPFGLFSFVSTGTWGENTSIKFDLSQLKKRARPDMEWLLNLIEGISSDTSNFLHLPIRRNPLIFNSGGRTHLHYLQQNDKDRELKFSSIRSTQLTEAIFELAKTTTTPTELRDNVLSQLFYLDLDKDKVMKVIQQLLNQQFLQTTLLPSFFSPSFFSSAFDNISSLLLKVGRKSSFEKSAESGSMYSPEAIDRIRNLIESYNKVIPGEGELLLKELQAEMEKFAPSKICLQVDTFYSGSELKLSKHLAAELESTAEFLWKLSCCTSKFSEMRTYHERFLEKYGTSRRVPLNELMNKNEGLGPPDHYLNPDHPCNPLPPASQEKKWYKWLKRELELCLKKGNLEIEIPAELIDAIIENPNKERAIPSFDLNCELIADSSSQLDSGSFLLHIHFVTSHGGSVFGRFLDVLGDATQHQLRAFLKIEEELEPSSCFANVCYFPSRARLANVKISPNLREKTLDLIHETDICLEDIVVGATHDRLYLTLKNQSKELVVVTNHMLSRSGAPPAIRFIEDVSESRYATLRGFTWFDMDDNCFLPRVRIKKTILSPARWTVNLFKLGLPDDASYESIKEKFVEWGLLWDLPQFIYLTDFDNRLLLDRSCSSHLEQIVQKIKSGESVQLTETLGKEKKQWVQTQKGTHFSEFTIPFIKNKEFSSSLDDLHFTPHIPISPNTRWKLPGSEWFYVKFYSDPLEENTLLSKECLEFAQKALDLSLITEWFYIRYADPKPHLRLRFRIKEGASFENFTSHFHDWSSRLLHHHFIYDVSLGSYEREIERYGGEQLIEYAETVFCADSFSSIDILRHPLFETDSRAREIHIALSIIQMFYQLGLTLQEQVSFYCLGKISQDELDGFRSVKSSLLKYAQAIIEDTLDQYPEMQFFCQAIEKRKKALSNFAIQMNLLEAKNALTSSPDSIIGSLIHMHCNRLIGREHKKEKKAYAYAFHTLKILSHSKFK